MDVVSDQKNLQSWVNSQWSSYISALSEVETMSHGWFFCKFSCVTDVERVLQKYWFINSSPMLFKNGPLSLMRKGKESTPSLFECVFLVFLWNFGD
jgi:hypothetical protein